MSASLPVSAASLAVLYRAVWRFAEGARGALVGAALLLTASQALKLTTPWLAGKDLAWQPLRAERVCEVKYDHLQGDRFRHATTFVRWRPDKRPDDCRYDQLEVTPPAELAEVFGQAGR